MKKHLLLLGLILLPFTVAARFQTSDPVISKDNISVRAVFELPNEAIRLSFNKADNTLYFITQNGGIYKANIGFKFYGRVQTSSDHGLTDVQGFDISDDGRFFIVGNERDEEEATNIAIIKRATIVDGVWNWETVAETDPYPLSNTAFDHIANGIVISPDQTMLYINSGSRTDHGEVHDVEGKYPGLREAPLTAKILQVPADTTNVLLENDLDYLKSHGFVYAEGTRNSFSLAFDGEGNLFGTENAGDRDDPEEINWLREGHHYGFPWVIGGNDTPMQYPDFDPDSDPFIPPNSTAATLGTFYNDPDYPARPDGIAFTAGATNVGPDVDTYRDAETGTIKDASDEGITISSFTSHLSPMGLVFDTDNMLGGEYTGDGFMLGFSGGAPGDAFLLNRMNYHGEDLIHLEFTKTEDNYQISATSIVRGFYNPIDTEIVGDKIYLIEFKTSWLNGSATVQLYEISFPSATSTYDQPLIPEGFALLQNYPNPFNPATVISYELPVSSSVKMEVFDLTGRSIATLVDGVMPAGYHEVSFDASGLSSGIYIYRIQSGTFSQTGKMMLVK